MCFLVSRFSHSAARHDRFRVEKSCFVSEKSEPKVVQTAVLYKERGSCGTPLIARELNKKHPPNQIGAMFARFSLAKTKCFFFWGGGRVGGRMRLGISLSLL